jgi:beta-glucosidase
MPVIEKGATRQQQEEKIEEILSELSLDEKIFMLSGHGFFEQIAADGGRYCASLYHIGAGNERLGVPPLLFMDGPRGIGMGASTCFPVPMARAATFDTDLERRVGDAIGRELRAHGGNLFGGVCINLLRHPAWGRAQEAYGEDPFLVGQLGAALTRGVQHHNVVATPKHFAANSMENARFKVDVKIDERALREVYLPHFKRCIDAGAGAVMSAYNQLNGAYCGHNAPLLTRILKEEWGFDGFVYSDFVMGCRGADACAAGLDVEAPDTVHYGAKLRAAVESGDVPPKQIDEGARRTMRSLFKTLAAPDPEAYDARQLACEAHVSLAREAASKSIVLLENDGMLPLAAADEGEGDGQRRLLVLGELADRPNTGDHGSSRVHPTEVVTPLAGLRAGLPDRWELVHDSGQDLDAVARAAGEADAVLVIAGYTHRDEGEYIPGEMVDLSGDPAKAIGGDRVDLGLAKSQIALIDAAVAAQPKTAVAVMAGSAVMMEGWRERVGAILMLWYPGMEGGHALADVVFGRVNPSGRLPFSVPKSADDLPFFDRDATEIDYDLWHGYTKLERDGVEPAYGFGFGRSYTEFEFANASAQLDAERDLLQVAVDVTNAGTREGATVAQVYAGWATPSPEQPLRRLCGFARAEFSAGETRRIEIPVSLSDLAFFDVATASWRLGAKHFQISIGASSAANDCVSIGVELPERAWSIRER